MKELAASAVPSTSSLSASKKDFRFSSLRFIFASGQVGSYAMFDMSYLFLRFLLAISAPRAA